MATQDDGTRSYFILGNVILGVAAVMLFFFGPLWEHLGIWALFLWMVLAALGVYLISTSSGSSPPGPPN
ncbi:hypothetical protein [Thioalkalivibrio paradoxus]|uniref:Uncharacterized protein n=1 Tax=Thioalkalivibrio paradoxus ARh 1 TaxID=713585 RepID=W0DHP9_9GAMM|nr:hypothetical protein [Thioalkalivibrio paradoxus]AHE98149.1 hypothetical protein THITH_07585 [Thioalkalivibrio paradoxus ARh 1]